MMPPHTSNPPRRHGNELVIEGYSLGFANLEQDLQIRDDRGHLLAYTAEIETIREDRSGGVPDPPPGSIQLRTMIRVRLTAPQGERSLTVSFLGDEWTL